MWHVATELLLLLVCTWLVVFTAAVVYLRGVVRRLRKALERARALPRFRSSPFPSRVLVLADVQILGRTVRTDLIVDTPMLEALANGMGLTITPIRSIH